jgi:dihydrofolate synthase/folylpolyglutamate synthase
MTYEEALGFIHSQSHFGTHKGLARMRELLRRMGDPQKKLRFVHIAGSNGKGSTAAMTERVLREAGYRTGLFVSPFVYDFRERMQIDGALPDKALLTDTLERIMPALQSMAKDGDPVSEFETDTALALALFAREKCDVVVFEVGIGGLLDSTNVIDPPLVAAICSLSLEHTELLGSTIEEIAYQKCGIIKRGSRVAAYCDLPREALPVLYDACARCGITPNIADRGSLRIQSLSGAGGEFLYKDHRYRVPLAGAHQVYNALTAIAITEELRESGLIISQAALEHGLALVRFPGRLETVREQPLCIVDGAHNPAKIASLCAALDRFYGDRRILTVMGMLKKKDHAVCIPQLARRSAVFFAVQSPAVQALTAGEVAAEAYACCADVRVVRSPEEAARQAVREAREGDLLLATGSLYLLSEAKKGFQEG